MAGAAAAAPDVHLRIAAGDLAHQSAELVGVALLQPAELAQRDLVHLRRVGPDAAQALRPGAGGQRRRELLRVGAVEREERHVAPGLGIHPRHRLGQRQARGEARIRAQREAHRQRHPHPLRRAHDAHRLDRVVEGHRPGEIGARAAQGFELHGVVVLGRLHRHLAVQPVGVAARADVAHQLRLRDLAVVFAAQGGEEVDRAEVRLGQPRRRVAQPRAPVGAGAVVEAADQRPHPPPRGHVQPAAVHAADGGAGVGLLQQREHREMGQVVAPAIHDLGLDPPLGEVVESLAPGRHVHSLGRHRFGSVCVPAGGAGFPAPGSGGAAGRGPADARFSPGKPFDSKRLRRPRRAGAPPRAPKTVPKVQRSGGGGRAGAPRLLPPPALRPAMLHLRYGSRRPGGPRRRRDPRRRAGKRLQSLGKRRPRSRPYHAWRRRGPLPPARQHAGRAACPTAIDERTNRCISEPWAPRWA